MPKHAERVELAPASRSHCCHSFLSACNWSAFRAAGTSAPAKQLLTRVRIAVGVCCPGAHPSVLGCEWPKGKGSNAKGHPAEARGGKGEKVEDHNAGGKGKDAGQAQPRSLERVFQRSTLQLRGQFHTGRIRYFAASIFRAGGRTVCNLRGSKVLKTGRALLRKQLESALRSRAVWKRAVALWSCER